MHTYTQTDVHKNTHTLTLRHTDRDTRIQTFKHTHRHTHGQTHNQIHTNTHTHTNRQRHTHAHIQTHTDAKTHKNLFSLSLSSSLTLSYPCSQRAISIIKEKRKESSEKYSLEINILSRHTRREHEMKEMHKIPRVFPKVYNMNISKTSQYKILPHFQAISYIFCFSFYTSGS